MKDSLQFDIYLDDKSWTANPLKPQKHFCHIYIEQAPLLLKWFDRDWGMDK